MYQIAENKIFFPCLDFCLTRVFLCLKKLKTSHLFKNIEVSSKVAQNKLSKYIHLRTTLTAACKNNKKVAISSDFLTLAASPGLEPRLTESESAVLPLDDEATIFNNHAI